MRRAGLIINYKSRRRLLKLHACQTLRLASPLGRARRAAALLWCVRAPRRPRIYIQKKLYKSPKESGLYYCYKNGFFHAHTMQERAAERVLLLAIVESSQAGFSNIAARRAFIYREHFFLRLCALPRRIKQQNIWCTKGYSMTITILLYTYIIIV
jgi:hypothetical protein